MDDTVLRSPDYPGYRQPAGAFTAPAPQHQRTSQLNSGGRTENRSHVKPAAVEKMRSRNERLKTYSNWPLGAPVGPVDLAEAGFFYLGEADQVKCFSCGCVVHRWSKGDNVLFEHRRISPLCSYLQSLEQHHPVSAPLQDPRMTEERNRLASFAGWPVDSPVKSTDLAEAGFFYTGTGDKVQCFSCLGAIHKWETGDRAWEEHKRLFPDCEFINGRETGNIPIKVQAHKAYEVHGFSAGVTEQQQPWHTPMTQEVSNFPMEEEEPWCSPPAYNMSALSSLLPSAYPSRTHFQYESMRIESFQHPLWPSDSVDVSVTLLGQAGFYYTCVGDVVKCFSCHLELGRWKRGDSPFGRHMELNPACPFVQGIDTQNIPTRFNIKAGDTAMSGNMRSVAQRLASFAHWPRTSPVNGLELAEAGFYYKGPGDLVMCCCCGILASDWVTGDKPVDEHKKHNKKCPYIFMYFPESRTTGSRLVIQADQISTS